MTPARPRVEAVAVVVPVHDEEELLPACLAALRASVDQARATRPWLDVVTVVVLDDCTDASARAVPPDVERVEITARTVGLARTAGTRHALGLLDAPAAQVWIASTDADSVVPPDWVTHHLDLADDGADVVVGGVRPDLAALSEGRARAWLRRYVPGVANGHVHGANLGVRADVHLAAGGYPPVPEHEDVALVEAARRLGARVVPTADAWVLTSARLVGRTPGGYARYLREDLERLAT
ncbi:glycosyl transferase family 2 [Sediminihabitans luteus]|uniref:4,4'-diaponeurosporenoate glycosyltransferase n=1 Tax=Sediminihabitans luteus TaxID=1138585 RepID=A0A2M9CC26_9CELL|nr:glycosyltransferase [Sediminihabitans luteus]PJJ68611.1 glycosyl transferase family 2 [Sediminihabitans luteus]GII99949.1 glycosyl transferase [Sediminihabitans luteus]